MTTRGGLPDVIGERAFIPRPGLRPKLLERGGGHRRREGTENKGLQTPGFQGCVRIKRFWLFNHRSERPPNGTILFLDAGAALGRDPREDFVSTSPSPPCPARTGPRRPGPGLGPGRLGPRPGRPGPKCKDSGRSEILKSKSRKSPNNGKIPKIKKSPRNQKNKTTQIKDDQRKPQKRPKT